MSSRSRLAMSALVAFLFYFGWTYWANSLVTDDLALILRSALVQGSLSGSITIIFTFTLEKVVQRFGSHYVSLVFVVPILCSVYAKTKQNIAIFKTFNHALDNAASRLSVAKISGALLAPLIPILMQGSIAITVNLINHTPNLLLTVTPSIVFSALYGYVYTFTLLKNSAKAIA
ncbi:hypothetical protein FX988_03179 [Paraglaciecola mesophila]|uniref:Uncharacterized protein n=1 Tax=Paraglaciecola mesophila TaxID=197222 RepID=A0A857JPF4_9ALTE|nr:hypothetical protein [Paraglaciecola mesophila]QHJ12921.1 hypothetical protein FX988_03179 [Paraglaciecola mesophila]